MLWAVDKFASYLQARPFTLITDCSALIWLFKSQALSAKYHQWALRLMQYDIDLQWRPGTKHQFADALSRSHGLDRGATVDDSLPGDNTTKKTYRGPQGPVLDGVHLDQMGIEGINNAFRFFFKQQCATFHGTCRSYLHTRLAARRHQHNRTPNPRPLIGYRTDAPKSCSHWMRGGGK